MAKMGGFPTQGVGLVDKNILEKVNSLFNQFQVASDIMTKQVTYVTRDDTVGDALNILLRKKHRHLLVVDPEDKTLVGIVSDRDILKIIPPELLNSSKKLTESSRAALEKKLDLILGNNPITVNPQTSLSIVVGLILKNKINCLPVVDGELRVEGIITSTDLLLLLLQFTHIGNLAKLVS
jgi:CBS domain-containing protein